MAGNRVISAVLTLKDKDFGTNAKKSATAMTDLQRKTKHSGNTIKEFGRSATSSFKSVATGAASIVAAIGVTRALSGAFNMVKSSVSSAFDRIDTMEAFERTLTTLTGSADKSKAALEATRDAVKGTAFGLDTAAKGVQDFVTRGMEVSKATDTMAIWGDAVAFYGDGSNEQLASVSDALAKMYSSGKVSMDQMNRLFDAGIDGVGMYAKATNRDVASVQKDLSKGKITASEFLNVVGQAMEEGTGGVQKIAGAAKEAGASWGATFGNMRAAVTRGVEGIIVKIDEMLTSNGLPDMRTMVSDFGGKFEDVLGGVAGKIPMVTTYLVGMYQAAQPALGWISDTALPAMREGFTSAVEGAKGMYDFVVANWPMISPVIAGVAAAVAAFKIGVVAITVAQRGWAIATAGVQLATALLNGTLALSPFGWVVLAIGAVVAAGVALYQNWDTVKERAGQLWQKLQDNPLLWLAGGPIGAVIGAAVTLYQNFDKIKASFNAFSSAIKSFVLPKWVATIGSTLSSAAGKVKGFFSGGGGPQASFDVGTNRVSEDMVAKIHKDEMIVPATQAHNLRKRGVTIDNIDKGGLGQQTAFRTAAAPVPAQNGGGSDRLLMQLLHAIQNLPKGDVIIKIDGYNKSVSEIVNELVPLLKLRIANM